SLWRFLERACHPDPEQRFRDADEMAEALHGVLCQVAAAEDGAPRPSTSTRFTPPRPTLDGPDWRLLPQPLLPNHPRLANRVAGIGTGDPWATVGLADAARPQGLSWADAAAVARALCEVGDHRRAAEVVELLDPASPDAEPDRSVLDAARSCLRGVVALAAGRPPDAVAALDAAYAAAPGELACAFAFAAALEATGDPASLERAASLYQRVAMTDPSWVAATAGLARTLADLGRPVDAARVLATVPTGHPLRAEALTLALRALNAAGTYDERAVAVAVDHLRSVRADARGAAEAELAVELYSGALAAVQRGQQVGPAVGDVPASVPDLAAATEGALLELADVTSNRDRRHAL